jgi:molybdate transport system substrate-binding protein
MPHAHRFPAPPELAATPAAPVRSALAALAALAVMAAVTLATATPTDASAQTAPALGIYAAGSLRAALTEVARAFEQGGGGTVQMTFGASGLLRDRLAAGESAQVFASANMTHPEALAATGQAQPVTAFARNALCVLAAPGFSLQGQPLAQRLLDPALKLGTSTPKADPSGDYAFQMFERIEATGAGAAGSGNLLKARALQLTGGPTSPPPPAGRNVYGMLVAEGQADVFITYCTNATLARREHPALQVLQVPEAINVSATYGMVLMNPVVPAAQAYAAFVLGREGQAILASHGFSAP